MARLRWITLAFVVLWLFVSAVAQNDEAALQDFWDQWAEHYNQPDLEALADLYAEDVRYLAPDAEDITTRQGLLERWQGLRDAGLTEIAAELDEVKVFGNTAYFIGTFTFNPGAEATPSGDVMTIAERTDGAWKITRHIFNLDEPPDPEANQ